ncbi:fatty acid desaturase family protein [Evansella cellulosilytica]|uniref:Fatty acid desaturase n=1 Tax=Evansella cellulosilytica (strain ATCC 21833 / DSM 2522 / FERM P-1141 / JCM 9156 / N-4) TaxID=649639 RepID=E6TUV2_EVAC2|nr:acyl-CoA desaturase [Evansella cellulosilytica]ADU32104.1 fatty acid desaturase [Evansella cellulosilytica DSM 2522]
MKELHTFGWYAARLAKHLPKEYHKPTPQRLLGGLAYVMIVVGGFLSIALFELPLILNIGIAVILGMSFAGMGFLGHEILHGNVVRKPWLRNFLGAVAFWPLSTGPQLWRKWHNMNHHVHTQHDENDPDSWPTLERISKTKFVSWIYRIPFIIRSLIAFASLSVQFTAHSLKCLMIYIKDFQPKKRPVVIIQAILPWATWIGLLFVLGFHDWFFAFLLPLLIANFVVMAYISTNHRLNPLVPVNDPLANSLTVTVPKWLDWIHFNFSYHTEHHIFPAMSSKYYPEVKRLLKEMWPERYHEMPMTKALLALIKTPRVYFEHNDLVDPNGGKIYGSLGNGLNPEKITSKPLDLNNLEEIKKENKIKEENDLQA